MGTTSNLKAVSGCRLRLGRSRCPKQGFRRQTLFWRCFGWHSHRSHSRPDTFKCNCPDALSVLKKDASNWQDDEGKSVSLKFRHDFLHLDAVRTFNKNGALLNRMVPYILR